jgi:hypothetical protein
VPNRRRPILLTLLAQSAVEALGLLRELNATGARNVPDNAPTLYVPSRWQGYLDDAAANGDATAYRHYPRESATLDSGRRPSATPASATPASRRVSTRRAGEAEVGQDRNTRTACGCPAVGLGSSEEQDQKTLMGPAAGAWSDRSNSLCIRNLWNGEKTDGELPCEAQAR